MRQPRLTPLAVAAALAACRPPAGELPLCPTRVASARAVEADTRVLPPAVWFQVLMPGVARPALTLPERPRDCSGRPIEPEGAEPTLPRRPLAESDLTFGEGPEGQLLIWARALQFADGTALGPVALVRWVDRGLEIRGLGPLRAPTRRVRLRLEALGPDHLLVADGERCVDPDPCIRELALVPLRGRRFLPIPLVEDEREGPARLPVAARHESALPDGWVRRAELRRHLRVEAGRAVIGESIDIRDCDARATPETCQDQLHARDERPLRIVDDRLITTASAWTRLTGDRHDP